MAEDNPTNGELAIMLKGIHERLDKLNGKVDLNSVWRIQGKTLWTALMFIVPFVVAASVSYFV